MSLRIPVLILLFLAGALHLPSLPPVHVCTAARVHISSPSSASARVKPRAFFATTVKGGESILAAEIKTALSHVVVPGSIKAGSCGVHFSGSEEAGMLGLLYLRSALRLLECVIETDKEDNREVLTTPEDLYAFVSKVDWTEMIEPTHTIKVDTVLGTDNSRELTHSHFSSLTIKNAIIDQFRKKVGARPTIDLEDPDLPLLLYLHRGKAILYRVWSGEMSMHKRGYRTGAIHKAALRETTAAALILASGWQSSGGKDMFVDPMCGSGSFCIEAALIACNTAPGLIRYGCADLAAGEPILGPPSLCWAGVSKELWQEVVERAEKKDLRKEMSASRIKIAVGNDIHAGAIELAKHAATAAGVYDLIEFSTNDAEHLRPQAASNTATIITNPPWDQRLSEDTEASWRKLGSFARTQPNAPLWILAGTPKLLPFLELGKPSSFLAISAANTDMRFLHFPSSATSGAEQA